MRRFLAGLCLGLSLAACRKHPESRPDASGPPPGAPSPDTAMAAGAPSPQARLIALLPCGKDSAVGLYDDTSGDGDEYVRHRKIDSLPQERGYFVERKFYEGGDWLFVSKSDCARTSLFGPARFNPSRTRFAAVSEDREAGFSANGIQIVSLESGGPVMAIVDRMDVWGPQAGAWTDDSTFAAELVDLHGQRQRRIYGLRGGAWSFRDEMMAPRPSDSLPFPEVEDEGPPGD